MTGRIGASSVVRVLDAVARPISISMAVISAAGVVAIMALMIADVLMRTITGASIRGAYEIIVTVLVVVIFMGAPYGERSGANVRVTILTDRLKGVAKRMMHMLSSLIILAITTWIAIAVIGEAQSSFESNEMTLGVVSFPLWPAKAAMAVGLTFLAVEALINVLRSAAGENTGLTRTSEPTLEEVHHHGN